MTTELKPGDRVLIEAVAQDDEHRGLVLRIACGNGLYLTGYKNDALVWHRDDRAELAAELEWAKAELAEEAKTIDGLVAAWRQTRRERDELRAELDQIRGVAHG